MSYLVWLAMTVLSSCVLMRPMESTSGMPTRYWSRSHRYVKKGLMARNQEWTLDVQKKYWETYKVSSLCVYCTKYSKVNSLMYLFHITYKINTKFQTGCEACYPSRGPSGTGCQVGCCVRWDGSGAGADGGHGVVVVVVVVVVFCSVHEAFLQW